MNQYCPCCGRTPVTFADGFVLGANGICKRCREAIENLIRDTKSAPR